MKKLLLLLVFLFVLPKAKAQVVFCPPGAEWHYNFVDYWPYYLINEKIKYTGDTLILGETVKKLSHSRFFIANNNPIPTWVTYIKQSGDTIFMKNVRTQNSRQILYNFASLPGQGWNNTIHDGTSTPVLYHINVDSVTHITINGMSLKRLYVRFYDDLVAWGDGDTAQITERIGCNKFLFNYQCHEIETDDDMLQEFLCYQDNSFGAKQFSSKPCNLSDATGLKENNLENSLNIFPNPAKDFVSIKINASTDKKFKIKISNVAARELEVFQLEPSNDFSLNISSYKAGIYFINIIYKERIVETKKLVIIK